jgi:hypothetical protein
VPRLLFVLPVVQVLIVLKIPCVLILVVVLTLKVELVLVLEQVCAVVALGSHGIVTSWLRRGRVVVA